MKRSCWSAVGLSVAIAATASVASAQTRLDGFAVNTFEPSERGSHWFALQSLRFGDGYQPTMGVVFDFAHKPLVFHQDEEEIAVPIENQAYLHLGGSLKIAGRYLVGLSLPVAVVHDGNSGTVGPLQYDTDSGVAAGDLRMSGHARFFGEDDGSVRAGLGLLMHFPTGRQETYVSDGKMRVEPRLELAGDVGPVTYAARLGLNLRARNEDYLNHPFGSQMTFGVAAGARLMDEKLVVGPELYGSTMVSDGGDGFMKRAVTPVDLLLGAHYDASSSWRFGLGGGPGFTKGWGSPDYRIVASLAFVAGEPALPSAAPLDADGDGIVDGDDACPDQSGPGNEDPAKHGCPDSQDGDGDGVPDEQDACPAEAGPANLDRMKNGCPAVSDRDGDAVADEQDACPDQPGQPSDQPSKNGCPAPSDKDGDGVLDASDACPDQAGQANADPKKNGCPVARIVGGAIKISERIEFDPGEAVLRPESETVLRSIAGILEQHPEIKLVSVEGHTDNRGGAGFNRQLSAKRAEAVAAWLVSHGIDRGRLKSAGFGPDRPVDTNDTEQGRQNNRRVEFRIVERSPVSP